MTSQIPFTPVTPAALEKLTGEERAVFVSAAGQVCEGDVRPSFGDCVTLIEIISRLITEDQAPEANDETPAYWQVRATLAGTLNALQLVALSPHDDLAAMARKTLAGVDERLRDLDQADPAAERDEARADRDNYAARLRATDQSWAKLAAQRDRLAAALHRLASGEWLGTEGYDGDEMSRRREYASEVLKSAGVDARGLPAAPAMPTASIVSAPGVSDLVAIGNGPLLDPDCRDGKHASCLGAPCECPVPGVHTGRHEHEGSRP